MPCKASTSGPGRLCRQETVHTLKNLENDMAIHMGNMGKDMVTGACEQTVEYWTECSITIALARMLASTASTKRCSACIKHTRLQGCTHTGQQYAIQRVCTYACAPLTCTAIWRIALGSCSTDCRVPNVYVHCVQIVPPHINMVCHLSKQA